MHWNENLKIKIPIIDTQHKQLFLAYSELDKALKEGLRPAVVQGTLEKMHHYVARHFTMEEKYMKEVEYDGIAEQIEEHRYFSKRFDEILTQFNKDGLTPAIVSSIQQELGEWLRIHVSQLDMEFGKFYNSRKGQD